MPKSYVVFPTKEFWQSKHTLLICDTEMHPEGKNTQIILYTAHNQYPNTFQVLAKTAGRLGIIGRWRERIQLVNFEMLLVAS